MENTKATTWYLVADGARARVIELKEGNFVSALNQEFVGRNLKSRGILTDRQGQRSPGGPAIPSDPHEHDRFEFALELAEILARALSDHRFEYLALVAPPEMLGDLRRALPQQVRRHVVIEEHKDLSELPDKELAERLRAIPGPPPQ